MAEFAVVRLMETGETNGRAAVAAAEVGIVPWVPTAVVILMLILYLSMPTALIIYQVLKMMI